MQKLSVYVLERMIKAKLTSKEVDFILCVARYQSEYGISAGMYYKDLCEEIDLSYQGFYDCKKSLEKKGIITCVKNSYYDYDITILDNSFVGKENFGRGYVSLHNKMVRSKEFMQLKANSKLMALWLMREWQIYKSKSGESSYPMLKENFLKKFKELMGITSRMARSYLGMLKPFMNIYLEDGRKYYFTFKENEVKALQGKDSENGELRTHTIDIACRRNRIKNESKEHLKDIYTILSIHHGEIKRNIAFDLSRIVRESLEQINDGIKNKYQWKRYLSPGLIHKLVKMEL